MTKERVCAISEGVSRRTLIECLSATAAAAGLPTFASSQAVDPLVPLYHEWIDARREWISLAELPGNEEWDDPRSEAAAAREAAAAEMMLALRPTSLEGVAALVALLWYYVEPPFEDPTKYSDLAKSPECRAVKAIWQACTGKSGYPEV